LTESLPVETREVVIIGGGGHAAVVAEAAVLGGMALAGFLDDSERAAVAEWAVAIRAQGHDLKDFKKLGGLESLSRISPEQGWIIAVGELGLRQRIIAQILALQEDREIGPAATVVHPQAFVSPTAGMGAGVFVGPRAVVHPRAAVGDHAIVNTAAVIEHDVRIGENAHIAPGAVLGGGVVVEADGFVGLGARVLPTIRIGSGAVVGAGAVVIRDVEPGTVVVGVPAVAIGMR
jgi:sugar O-acyltransferase (sialic acid O-acetyltransferase NeuD family)